MKQIVLCVRDVLLMSKKSKNGIGNFIRTVRLIQRRDYYEN